MTLSPEQFNKLALKTDLDELRADLKDFKIEMSQFRGDVLRVLDSIVKKLDDMKSESFANLAAHDRFENRLNKIEEKVF